MVLKNVVLHSPDQYVTILMAWKQDYLTASCASSRDKYSNTSVHDLNIKILNNLGNPPTVKKFAIEGTTKISFRLDETINFYCEAKGTPPLQYVWLLNNEVIDKRRDNRLIVAAAEKTEGEYQCRVENLFGSDLSEVLQIKVGEFKLHLDGQ